MIVHLASGLSYLKFALGRWLRIPSCVSMYVFARNTLPTRKKRKILRAQGQNLTITFSEVAHFTITFSEFKITLRVHSD